MTRKTRRKAGAKRHPNGRIVHTGPAIVRALERDAKAVAEEARMKHYKLSRDNAGRPEAATAVGRLLIAHEISEAQHEAAKRYHSLALAYRQAICAPGELGSAGDLERGGGHDGRDGTDEPYVEQCAAARRDFSDARRALLEVGSLPGNSLVPFAVNSWAVDNEESWSTIGELRIGLNALARLWKIPEQMAA